jgi:hypothetical protein
MLRARRPGGVMGLAPAQALWRPVIADHVGEGRALNWVLLRYTHLNGRSLLFVENRWHGDADDESLTYAVASLPPLNATGASATQPLLDPVLLLDGEPASPKAHTGTSLRWGMWFDREPLTALVFGFEVRPELLDLVTVPRIGELLAR